MRSAPILLFLLLYSAADAQTANEKVGAAVRSLADTCVGMVLLNRDLHSSLVQASRTATSVCTCASELAVSTTKIRESSLGLDGVVQTQSFLDFLSVCTKSKVR